MISALNPEECILNQQKYVNKDMYHTNKMISAKSVGWYQE